MKSFLKKIAVILIFIGISPKTISQVQTEVAPPFNIKSISFVQNQQNVLPVFEVNEGFMLQFDDLYGNDANYYYEIIHCDYNWVPTQIPKTEYLQGFDNMRILQYNNSVNTLQIYSHFQLPIPNSNTRLLLSGNYLIKILDEDHKEVFSRRFMLYQNLSNVGAQVKRARNVQEIAYKQNIECIVQSKTILFQNPSRNVKLRIIQNFDTQNTIENIAPQYTVGNDLIYKYDKETQFWGGNEFLFFDNKDIKNINNTVGAVATDGEIFKTLLYTTEERRNKPYTNLNDLNGNFVIRNINGSNPGIEADYAWVYFKFSAPTYYEKKDLYVLGNFNNYLPSPEYKMEYNTEKKIYEKAVLLKQGFVNYQYQLIDEKGKADLGNNLDGNFYQTENQYTILVYYRDNIGRYDQIIGKGSCNSVNITN